MILTPQDIQGQVFNKKVNGYDKDEVKQFLVLVSEALENEIIEKEKIRKKYDKTKEALLKFEKREDILRDTLVSAQRFSKDIKKNSEKEAEMIIKESEMKGEEIINNANHFYYHLKSI